jgi:hypothetical protein
VKLSVQSMIDNARLLNPADNPKLFKSIWLRMANGENIYAVEIIIDQNQGVVFAKAESGNSWHHLPLDQWVGFEIEMKRSDSWFKDAVTLPAVIAKLTKEKAIAAA